MSAKYTYKQTPKPCLTKLFGQLVVTKILCYPVATKPSLTKLFGQPVWQKEIYSISICYAKTDYANSLTFLVSPILYVIIFQNLF